MNDSQNPAFKVVLIFDLKPGSADEELRRSREQTSFPRKLAAQPGFQEMQLVRVSDDQTMSVQSWASAEHWWAALEAVKGDQSHDNDRETILVSRQFFGGPVAETLEPVNTYR